MLSIRFKFEKPDPRDLDDSLYYLKDFIFNLPDYGLIQIQLVPER